MKYPLAIRILHWLMAVIIICLLCVGLLLDKVQGDLRSTLFFLHKSFGVLILILFCVRVFLRNKLGTPPLPEVIPPVERKLATYGHYFLYCFMVAMPVSGYLMTNAFGRGVPFFGLTLPKLIGTNKDLGHLFDNFHELAGYTLIAVVAGHISAVIYHYLKEHVNLLKRMW